ncbi:hypothetical protein J437_LFUL013390 [Ladona fulva]|uniref:Uncharacterized protein n=1 Tax=Ladona fulva TaxID=123851 RepID=A0A8K0KME9_LADFU|nr:hypothetical protein J437_LFUL013390 [Ladona fulva]
MGEAALVELEAYHQRRRDHHKQEAILVRGNACPCTFAATRAKFEEMSWTYLKHLHYCPDFYNNNESKNVEKKLKLTNAVQFPQKNLVFPHHNVRNRKRMPETKYIHSFDVECANMTTRDELMMRLTLSGVYSVGSSGYTVR